jgi:hypothetical protein
MKKTILALAMMLSLTGLVKAQQQLLNPGFELWDTLGDYTQPSHWFTLNPLVQFGFDPTTSITTDAHSGNYAVVMESKGTAPQDLSGVLSTGPILTGSFEPDFEHLKIAFTSRPERLQFYYKSFPQGEDSSVLTMVLTRWNVSQQRSDTVAEADFFMADSIGIYTLANIEFEYHSPLPPDSALMIMSSSADGFNPVEGTKFMLDDILLVYPTGINELSKLNLNIYPNPVKDLVTIDVAYHSTVTVELYDQTGRRVMQAVKTGNDHSLDVSALNSGIYFMVLRDENGAGQQTKLVIED